MRPGATVVAAAAVLAFAGPALAQQTLTSPEGDSLRIDSAELRVLLDTARALRADLELDPRVLYILGFGPPAEPDAPREAYPWNAVQPQSDSTVAVTTPGNLREADRAYNNYSVMRMRTVRRDDPDDPCEAVMEREAVVLSSFVDGWILARTLYGGPAYAPLDEFAFARASGHLPALLAVRGGDAVSACAADWIEENAGAVERYEAWREEKFPGLTVSEQPAPAVDPVDGGLSEEEPAAETSEEPEPPAGDTIPGF